MRRLETNSKKIATTLEGDLENIKTLHDLRERADQLRKDAIGTLHQVMKAPDSKEAKRYWADLDDEPKDLVHPALVVLAARRDFVRHVKGVKVDDFLSGPLERLKKAKLKDFVTENRDTNRVPVFQAARVLEACLTSPADIFSKRSIIAYYRVVRELMTVGPGKRVYGAARAIDGGLPSAFMTSECARALGGMGRALRSTADLIDVLVSAIQEAAYASKLKHAPMQWMKMESRRIALCAYSEIARVARKAVIPLSKTDYETLFQDHTGGTNPLSAFCDVFCKQFSKVAQDAAGDIDQAIEEVTDHYDEEPKDKESRARDAGRHLGHTAALEALEKALELAKKSQDASANIKKLVEELAAGRPVADLLKKLGEVTADFRERSNDVGRLLDTTQLYTQTVLDKEIERHSTGQMNSGELIFAAAAYSAQGRPEADRRVKRAAQILCRSLLWDGTFAVSSVLDTDEHGYSAVVLMAEVHRAFAFLLDKSHIDVEPEVVERLVNYFDSTAIRLGDESIVGWAHDQPRYPRRASRWITALCILALDRITRMLDRAINRKVIRHFSATSPKDLRSKPRLNELFYSDYGLVRAGTKFAHERVRKESIAFHLERMRAHVLGLESPPDKSESPKCYALLLFGPPGTGKTTLIEAVAASSDVHYIEVTPSDFLVEGDALIERRARDVFKCLSYLTRTVILFDEFDPMIRSREIGDPKGKLDQFAFLTPGMLPKLKALNESAKKRNSAYCLITNRIGILDPAATRSGRFDVRVGVYPPDLLARVGRLAFVAEKTAEQIGKAIDAGKFFTVVEAAGGGGMTTLGKGGNFSPSKELPKKPDDLKKRSALDRVFNGGDFDRGPVDADFKEKRSGTGDLLALEDRQWCCVKVFDKRLKAKREELEKEASPDWIKALKKVANPKLVDDERKWIAEQAERIKKGRQRKKKREQQGTQEQKPHSAP
jgi:hypothetical protein